MYCTKCGKEIAEGSLFCGSCGAKVGEPAQKEETGTASSMDNAVNEPAQSEQAGEKPRLNVPDKPAGKLPGKLIAVVAAVVIVVIVVIAVAFSGRKITTVSINDYVSVSFSGYDTVGTASVEFDYDTFTADYADLEWDEDALLDLMEEVYDDEYMAEIEDYIEEVLALYEPADLIYEEFYYAASLDSASGLSNGDTVTLTWEVSEEELEEIGTVLSCEFEYTDIEATVTGLEEVGTYDPFDDIEVSFSGTAPSGTASASTIGSGNIASSLRYSLNQTNNLSNGDTVTVTITTDADAFVESDGVVLSPVEKEYTVEGLSYYVTSAEEIPETDLERMQEEVADSFTAYVASNWADAASLLGFDYIGSYLLSQKSGGGNIFYMVYQVNSEIFEETSTGFVDELYTYYYYACYEDLVLTADGELQVDYLDFDTVSNRYNPYSNYNYYGYEKLDELYKVVVTARADSYTSENLVEDADFGYETVELDAVYSVPEDALEYDGHYYKLYSINDMTWSQAKEQCELRGGHLVTITSEDEENFLTNMIISGSRCYWTGGYYEYTSDEWLWITEEDLEYTCWLTSKDTSEYRYLTICGAGWMQNSEEGGNWGGVTTGGGYNSSVIGYICEWDSDISDSE